MRFALSAGANLNSRLDEPLGLLAARFRGASKSRERTYSMSTNRGVVYIGPGKVEVQGIDYPKFIAPNGKEIDHRQDRLVQGSSELIDEYQPLHSVRAFNVSATVASSECSVPTVIRCCRSSSKGGS